VRCIDQRRVRANLHVLGCSTHFEHRIDARRSRQFDLDTRLYEAFEAGQLRLDAIAAGRQELKRVLATLGGGFAA
jgi:hypothetical protein